MLVTGTNLKSSGGKQLSETAKTPQLTPRGPGDFVCTVMEV